MNIKISKITINKFRKIIDVEPIEVGNRITVISGVNGVGKSNLLSLIAAGSGLTRSKTTGGNFQPKFTEYFKIKESENVEEYKIYIEYKNKLDDDRFVKRISFKDDSSRGRGIRVIPRTSNNGMKNSIENEANRVKLKYKIGGAARVPLPTVFLSLSRLFPLGESNVTSKTISNRNSFFQNEVNVKYKEWYNIVFPGSIDSKQCNAERLTKEITKSSAFYIPLESTTAETQSVGQDNLGHIISSLVDFYNLSLEEEYSGGILCIDEVDASLHPSAQKRLLDLFKILAEELNLQIFLSTHSLTFLKEIIDLNKRYPDDYKLIYFKDQRFPYPTSYINYNSLKADMFDEMNVPSPKVKLYCEDATTCAILNLLMEAAKNLQINKVNSLPQFEVIPVYLGCNQLLQLPNHDNYFKAVAILVDGDARSERKVCIGEFLENPDIVKGFNTINHRDTTVFLPGFLPPESYLFMIINEYIVNTQKHFDFWRTVLSNPDTTNYTSDRIKRNIVDVMPNNNKQLKNKDISNHMFDFFYKTNILTDYYKDNSLELESFVESFWKALITVQEKLKARNY